MASRMVPLPEASTPIRTLGPYQRDAGVPRVLEVAHRRRTVV